MAEPATAAAVVLPAADQPPPVGATKTDPFAKRWAAVADSITDDAEESAETPEAAPSKAAPKKDAKAPGDPKEAKRAQLKTLAEELGLNIDDSAVTVAERAEHRAAMRRDKEKLATERAEFERSKALKPEQQQAADFGAAIKDAYDRGDPDGFAKALGAKDFNEFQTSFIKRLADPNYNELRRLQQKVEEKEAAEKKAAEEAAKREEAQKHQHAYKTYMDNLTEICRKSTNPVVAAFADEPLFLSAVYRIQDENWNDETQSTLTVEQAIKKAVRGGSADLETGLRGLYERGKKAFEEVGSTAPAAAAKTNGKRPAPKTAVVPVSSSGGGGPAKKPSEMTPAEWAAYRAKRMAEAED